MARSGADLTRAWGLGRRGETVLIGALVVVLTVVTILVADQVYRAGLAVMARPGQPAPWIWRSGEAGVGVLLGLAAGGWLAGAWLGERDPRAWAVQALAVVGLAIPALLVLDRGLAAAGLSDRLVPAGLTPESLWLLAPAALLLGLVGGGVLGAWWSRLAPADGSDQPENVAK